MDQPDLFHEMGNRRGDPAGKLDIRTIGDAIGVIVPKALVQDLYLEPAMGERDEDVLAPRIRDRLSGV